MIPFEERIPDIERIDQKILLAKHKIELSGIFNWAIEGLKKYQKDGLPDIPAVKNAVKEFKEEQDRLHDFIQDCCEIVEQSTIDGQLSVDISMKATDLYNIYVEWASYNNEKPMRQKRFSTELIERGIKRTHTREGSVYHGIQQKK
jgi:putative DNA primase/helicase